MRIVVTGATGNIGSACLRAAGHPARLDHLAPVLTGAALPLLRP